jgi:hypothetical protein
MVTTNALAHFISMILSQLAMLIVYVVAAIFAIKWWRRFPRPAMLLLLGVSIHLVTTVSWAALQTYLVTTYLPARGAQSVSYVFHILALVGGVLHAVATALMVGAVFAGRRGDGVAAGFPVQAPTRYAAPLT